MRALASPLSLFIACLVVGSGVASCGGAQSGGGPAADGGEGAAQAELEAAIARACTLGACTDHLARVTVWRDAAGEPRVLVHEGSLEQCSHPPTTYVSIEGEVLLGQANRPVRDAADAESFETARDGVLEGLRADARTHRCPARP